MDVHGKEVGYVRAGSNPDATYRSGLAKDDKAQG